MTTIVFTGGGTAGHVTPNVALISRLRKEGWDIHYIGSDQGIEKELIREIGVPFHAVSAGKLRRYFDLKNFRDPFRVAKGIFEAYRCIKKIKPDVVFSKGGFVAVPVVIAGWLNRVPVVIHESDMTPGLANRLSIPFASKVCVTFPETLGALKGRKAVHTGLPIRDELLGGDANKGLRLCDFVRGKPVLLVVGGSQGSRAINEVVRDNLPSLLKRFQVVHLCGKGNAVAEYDRLPGYRQFEYATGELPHLMAMADVVVSRAGATALSEFLALRKPMVLIPLPLSASRGDQLKNAQSFAQNGYAEVLTEERLTGEELVRAVIGVYERREAYIENMNRRARQDAAGAVIDIIRRFVAQKG
jgi:UDP-N-acetylglucosamine--N-acetylmuramyl-(pentapeptide) pyrophosphoryl-undecaprenol N-acetylglucosamine transferase